MEAESVDRTEQARWRQDSERRTRQYNQQGDEEDEKKKTRKRGEKRGGISRRSFWPT